MSTDRPPHSVPTLTEVVDWLPPEASQPAADSPPAEANASLQGPSRPGAADPAARATGRPTAVFDAAEVEQRVLADVQRQVELMLEVRLREALTPLLTRTADALVRDMRNELSAALRELVTRAVAQELARRST